MPILMKTSSRGLNLLKRFEGFKHKAYKDIGGVLTIGYGHTGPDVHDGQLITLGEGEALLAQDLEKFERCVQRAITVPMNQNQFDAFVVFAYNIGCRAFSESTAIHRFNAGKTPQFVAEAWAWWRNIKGKISQGLVNRRRAEIDLFLETV